MNTNLCNTAAGHHRRAELVAAEAARPYRGPNAMHPNQRSEKIHRLLTTDYDCCHGVDPESVLGDLLSDLRHFAHAFGIDFEAALAHAEFHFTAELQEEAEADEWEAGS